ncbi:MAG: S1/P1 nuclease [Muribaculaceae bacterium]|nr:S1/P1 nuclease [Muribaculaceae bacterium]
MKRTILANLMLLVAVAAFAWGQKGHDTTCHIAERHLTPATQQAVSDIFDGKSLVYWANWLDNASHTPEYAYTKTWHYKNVNADETFETAYMNPAGDVCTAMRAQIETLANPSVDKDKKALALKILIHITGDMHQPMHMGHASDLGGNRIKVKYFGQNKNLHSVWDSSLPESAHKWSYTEWADQLDRLSPEQQRAVVAGSIDDWAKQNLVIADKVYRETPAETEMSYDEVAQWTPVIEQQFLNGGLRLAHILNLIFDPGYSKNK